VVPNVLSCTNLVTLRITAHYTLLATQRRVSHATSVFHFRGLWLSRAYRCTKDCSDLTTDVVLVIIIQSGTIRIKPINFGPPGIGLSIITVVEGRLLTGGFKAFPIKVYRVHPGIGLAFHSKANHFFRTGLGTH